MKKILITALVILIFIAGVGYWMWNKPHEDGAGIRKRTGRQTAPGSPVAYQPGADENKERQALPHSGRSLHIG